MISICIPVYNFNVTSLLNELSKQGDASGFPYEIILIDDFSSEDFRKLNEKACKKHSYILLERNIGRARIRNMFLEYSKFNKLLFLDCDSIIISDDFLLNYINDVFLDDSIVIYGGTVYDENAPHRNRLLRWKYGIKRESQKSLIRKQSPFSYFRTNNFLIDKAIFEEIRFDERIVDYGHEDTLFSYMLMKNGVRVKHTDNPVLHFSAETNSSFLNKTEKSIANLCRIIVFTDYDHEFIRTTRIVSVFIRIKNLKFAGIIWLFLRLLKPFIKFLLSRGIASLVLFDLYKLSLLLQNNKRLAKIS